MGYAPFAKPGSFRFCPACGSRNKVQERACASCGCNLAGRHGRAVPTAVFSHRAAPGAAQDRPATLRWVLIGGFVIALGTALLVRGLLSGATIEAAGRPVETGVAARARTEPPPQPLATLPYTPGWNPGSVRSVPPPAPVEAALPPMPGAPSTPPSIDVMPPPPPPIGEAAASSGMVGLAPRPVKPRPLAGRAFTNDDLRTGGVQD
jgi:hypothetical protein